MTLFTVNLAVFDTELDLLQGLSALEIAQTPGGPVLLVGSEADSAVTSFSLADPTDPTLASIVGYSAGSGTGTLSSLEAYTIGGVTYGLTLGRYDNGVGRYSVASNGTLGFVAEQTGGIGEFSQVWASDQVQVGGTTYIVTSSFGMSGFRMLEVGAGGALSLAGIYADGAGQFLGDVSSFATGTLHGQSFLFAGSTFDAGFHAYTVGAGGVLSETAVMDPSQGTPFNGISDMDTVQIGPRAFVVVGASATSSLSVFRVSDTGQLKEVEHVFDNGATRLAGLTAFEVFQQDGRTFLVAGGSEDGISLFEMSFNGQLRWLETLADSTTTTLDGISDIEVRLGTGEAHIYVSSVTEHGFTVLTVQTTRSGQVIEGGAVKDVLVGTSGDDVLWGYGKSDTLFGEAGDDRLVDGRGRDVLYGGSGADVFEFVQDGRTDWIKDFEIGVDRIDLSGFDGLGHISTLTIESRGTGAVIFAAGEVFRLEKTGGGPIDVSQFDEDDFIFG
ncbi:MAG: M10 family metallopeptidase C-terminal domain-containing protein [Pseudomonadota bacterium]